MEDDRVVDAVQELRAEVSLQRVVHLLLHLRVVDRLVAGTEADRRLAQILGAEVRGHDQHGVAEVDRPTLGVGEATLFEDLQQRVEDVGVSLLDLVEQHDGERLAAHLLGELATLVVADVAGRRADEAADRVLLLVLRHVEGDQRGLVAEQELGEGLGELGLTDARRAEEDERTGRTLRVLQARTGATDRLGDGLDGVLLADDPLVQLVFHAEELLGLFLGELVDGDAGPQREHLGDGFLIDLVEQVETRRLGFGLHRVAAGEKFLLLVAQAAGLFELLTFDRFLLLADDVGDLGLELLVLRRSLHALDAQTRAGLVDQVDRLVGELTVRDVAVGEVGRGDDRLIGDRDPVIGLVAIAQTLEDLDGVGDRRFFDDDLLEATLEGGVLLEVLAELVEGGGADGLKLTAGEHRLEDRRRVDRTFGGTRTDEGVDLVDEEDDVAAGLDLLEDLLEALLEIASVAGPGDEGAEVERVELLVVQGLGHRVGGDRLGEALDDGGLADAGFADEHRVVLGAAAEDLHDPLGLAAAADDRVERLLAGGLGQVAAELVEHERAGGIAAARAARGRAGFVAAGTARRTGGVRARAGTGVPRQQLDDLLADPAEVGAELDEHLGRHAFAFTDQTEEDVLGTDVVVAELQRLAEAQLEDLLGPRGEGDVAAGRRTALTDDLLDLVADRFEADAERLQGLGGNAFTFVDEAEQDVLGADVVVVEQARFFLRQHHHSSSPVGKSLEHREPP